MSAERFAVALRLVLEFEGGFADDPADHGGRTMHGITQRAFDAWRASAGDRSERDVKTITDAEVASIYREDFWEPAGCDELAPPLDLVLFDTVVQHRSDVVATLRACAYLSESPAMRAYGLIAARGLLYRRIVAKDATQTRFLSGWLNRLARLAREAGL